MRGGRNEGREGEGVDKASLVLALVAAVCANLAEGEITRGSSNSSSAQQLFLSLPSSLPEAPFLWRPSNRQNSAR